MWVSPEPLRGTVTLVTCAALPGLNPDDVLLADALHREGIDTVIGIWEDPVADWSRSRVTIVRSAWDYHFRRAEFLAWAERVERVSTLWNDSVVLRWNSHKGYLRDLERSVPIVPTLHFTAGSSVDLQSSLGHLETDRGVLKPAVAASAYGATIVRADDLESGQRHLDRYLPHRDMLLQPYVDTIETAGELSVVCIDGRASHAVRKVPRPGDFKVQRDFGGREIVAILTEPQRSLAERAVARAPGETLYARVDLITDRANTLRVMEVELVEPELFLRHSADARSRFVAAIVERLSR